MKNLLIIAVLITVSSCTQSLVTPIEVSKEKEQWVVNGFVGMINQTTPAAIVQVSRTQKLSQAGVPTVVTDAKVDLNGTSLYFDPAIRLYVPQAAIPSVSTYKMAVGNGEWSATAEDVLPSFVSPSSVSFTGNKKMISRYADDTPTEYFELKISFDDPVSPGNYYQLLLSAADSNLVASGFVFGSSDYYTDFVCNDPGIYEEQITEQDPFSNSTNVFIPSDMLLLSDKYFNGQRKEITIYIADHFFANYNTGPDTSLHIRYEYLYVGLHHMSKRSFDYYKAVKLQQWNKDNPFAEPALVSGNVTGALGFFGCRSVATAKLKAPM